MLCHPGFHCYIWPWTGLSWEAFTFRSVRQPRPMPGRNIPLQYKQTLYHWPWPLDPSAVAFSVYDQDRDGFISARELYATLQALLGSGYPEAQLEQVRKRPSRVCISSTSSVCMPSHWVHHTGCGEAHEVRWGSGHPKGNWCRQGLIFLALNFLAGREVVLGMGAAGHGSTYLSTMACGNACMSLCYTGSAPGNCSACATCRLPLSFRAFNLQTGCQMASHLLFIIISPTHACMQVVYNTMAEYDADGDNKLDFNEFKQLLSSTDLASKFALSM